MADIMLVSIEKNFIFIHVAKTGGKALKKTLDPYAVHKASGQWRRFLSHLPIPEGLDAQFGPHSSARWVKLKLPKAFFDGAYKFAFVRNPYDLAVSRYSFIRGALRHHRHSVAKEQSFTEFLRAEKRRALWRRVDQTAMLCDWNGRLLVDHIYRFEEISDAYDQITERLGLLHVPELKRVNASKRVDYRSYYGSLERKLVEDIWARDLANFDYKF